MWPAPSSAARHAPGEAAVRQAVSRILPLGVEFVGRLPPERRPIDSFGEGDQPAPRLLDGPTGSSGSLWNGFSHPAAARSGSGYRCLAPPTRAACPEPTEVNATTRTRPRSVAGRVRGHPGSY